MGGTEIYEVSDKKVYNEVITFIKNSLSHDPSYKVMPKIKNIFEVIKKDERKLFDSKIGNERLMYHGSGVGNWIGILTRGVLLPKAVT